MANVLHLTCQPVSIPLSSNNAKKLVNKKSVLDFIVNPYPFALTDTYLLRSHKMWLKMASFLKNLCHKQALFSTRIQS